jgi:hypothetical protein
MGLSWRRSSTMSSLASALLVRFFRERWLAIPEILSKWMGVPLPAYSKARVASTELTENHLAEYRTEAVIVLLDHDIPVQVILADVQLEVDPGKRLRWLASATVFRAVYRCPVDLFIIAPTPAVLRWCAEPIETGVSGSVLQPRVLGVPLVRESWVAARWPELGVLSMLVYGNGEEGPAIATVVLPAIHELDDERARVYFDIIYSSLSETARRAEAVVQWEGAFAEKYRAQGRAEARRAKGGAEEDPR